MNEKIINTEISDCISFNVAVKKWKQKKEL